MRHHRHTALALALLAGAAAGCTGEGYAPRDVTSNDDCLTCKPEGGLFSGGDGQFTVLGGTSKKKLDTDDHQDGAE
ncbi:hypothetical protein SAMN05216241_11021 [Limimonas halophila]|uniref:Lipoprotein n=1 Tax=Limimonas halophila TaxID=1082479 RepID=A0A1G7TPR6_9PROT|nr:hypothetical protein [Limimonas halophila]SDG37211.1 hypothetical protein SAMN05216241_11021 [Limimonas halophila]